MKKEKNITDIMGSYFSGSNKPEDVKYWYDMGNYAINYTMSKNLKAGLPSGRIVCFDGLSGCLDENTLIKVKRGKRKSYREYTIKELYHKFNGLKWDSSKFGEIVWKKEIPSLAYSYNKERNGIFYNEIKEVLDSGEKECFELKVASGKSVTVSAEHPFKVPDENINGRGIPEKDNFVALKDLKVGETVMTKYDNKYIWEKITSIESAGIRHTYDIRMTEPNSNFVANDFVVHNTGKSLFSCNAAKDPNFDLIVIIDTEGGGIGKELLSYVGADLNKVILLKASTFESYRTSKKNQKIDVVAEKDMPAKLETKDYNYVEGATYLTKKLVNSVYYDPTLKDKKILFILDSIANLQSVREMQGTSDMGKRSTEIGRFFRTFDTIIEKTGISMIITNKLYTNIGNDYVPLVAAGGHNVIYNSSVIIRLSESSLSDDVVDADVKGNRDQKKTALGSNFKTMKATSIKSRFGTEGKAVQFMLETTSGLVRHSGLFKLLKDYGVIEKGGGAWYKCPCLFEDNSFMKKNFIDMLKEDGKEDERIEILQKELNKIEEERIKKIQESLDNSTDDVPDEEDEAEALSIELSDFKEIDDNIRENLINEIE